MDAYQMYVASSDSLSFVRLHCSKVYQLFFRFLCTLDIGGLQYQSFLSAVLCTLLNMRFCSHSEPLFILRPHRQISQEANEAVWSAGHSHHFRNEISLRQTSSGPDRLKAYGLAIIFVG